LGRVDEISEVGILALIKIPNAGTFLGVKWFKVIFVLQNERQNEIDDDRTPKSKKGKINKIHPHRCSIYTKHFSQPLAHTKSSLLKPTGNTTYHTTKIKQNWIGKT
jgi:hypothetical protein